MKNKEYFFKFWNIICIDYEKILYIIKSFLNIKGDKARNNIPLTNSQVSFQIDKESLP
jgi:hypothetical protein